MLIEEKSVTKRRYGLRDDQWNCIKDLLPGRKESVGVTANDNRLRSCIDIEQEYLGESYPIGLEIYPSSLEVCERFIYDIQGRGLQKFGKRYLLTLPSLFIYQIVEDYGLFWEWLYC